MIRDALKRDIAKSLKRLVPKGGVEPPWPRGPRDFESRASASSATSAPDGTGIVAQGQLGVNCSSVPRPAMAGGIGRFLPERQCRYQENLAAETKVVRKIGICKNVPRVCPNLRQKNLQISRLLSRPQSSRRTTFLSAKEHFASVIQRQVRNGRSRKTGARSAISELRGVRRSEPR